MGMSSAAKSKPPLPPPHGSSLDSKPSRTESPGTSKKFPELISRQPERHPHLQRQSPVIEQTILETHKHFSQDVTSQSPPRPLPRRRLASFGGMSTPGSLSPFTGLGAYQDINVNKTAADVGVHLSSSLGSRGSTGSLRMSPQNSGRTTPVTSLGSMQLQHVRDQMVVALAKLKELEEQVKIIPILQVKISVLQEEKRQLVLQLKNQCDNEDMERSCNLEWSDSEKKVNTDLELKDVGKDNSSDFREFRKLSEEMQALERTIRNGHLQGLTEKGCSSVQVKASKSVAVGTDINVDMTASKTSKESKYTFTDPIETTSIATEVTEVHLGLYSEQEAELKAQRQLNAALRERVCHLEAELKESALQTELVCLKLELQAAGARNRADKACLAHPSTVSTGTETKLSTNSQGVGNHVELRDAGTGETMQVKSVGVSCEPTVKTICTGPDVPIRHWEVRKQVETREKAVGIQVPTRTQGTATEIQLCDAESNTEEPVENLECKKANIRCQSLVHEDYSISMTVGEAKQKVSQGFTTDVVRGVDLGIMASPQTASQLTNTVSSSVSRFTNTSQAFSNNSSTNTHLSKQDKHTNTSHIFSRTVSVGNRIQGYMCTTETRSVGVNTANLAESILKQTQETVNKVTRDCGVGFTSIYENFLVGLKTRNMASGPSRLPDPIKTKSVGVGEGRIRDTSSDVSRQKIQRSTQFQWDLELNHYIEKMHRLLKEHGDLLTGDCDLYNKPKPFCDTKDVAQGGTEEHQFISQLRANTNMPSIPQPLLASGKSGNQSPGTNQQDGNKSEVKRMIKMLEQQSDSNPQDRSNVCQPWSVMKKQGGDQCGSNRKNMKFMKVNAGLDLMSTCEPEEEPRKGCQTFTNFSQDGLQGKKGKDGCKKGSKGSLKLYRQQRCKLSENMFSACQALKMHLSETTALSSRDMQDSLCAVQQEWFSVSSHRSAAPDVVGDYLSTFRMISPSVLRYIVNMTDGNGNTALHYSVFHSNFGVVKKLLDADVCDVNTQNTAGYTPIMLAALAAVENPEDLRVVEQLFAKGDVNAKASQAGQTALMLSVSHGRLDMVQALLAQGAEVNIQDDEGSTALMCASEHGH
ncbi:KN motif and ankyrin repeat domain-containing protein 1, partial [Austrofundulus limnaeus]|uniref:KN motif and ankyrin repeat domain-containing protein 1 n=1 Tax=Austrofundulus limnaeus TaxID=52670 RepID=A0A2I4D406_AUSLI